jgi:hypothetical protein
MISVVVGCVVIVVEFGKEEAPRKNAAEKSPKSTKVYTATVVFPNTRYDGGDTKKVA